MSKTKTNKQTRIRQKEEQLKEKIAECEQLRNSITQLREHHGLKISDHAKVRFLERASIISFKWVQEQLITQQVLAYYKLFGDGTYPTGQGSVRVVIRDGNIVTVLSE